MNVKLIPKAEAALQELAQDLSLSRTDLVNRSILLYHFYHAQARDHGLHPAIGRLTRPHFLEAESIRLVDITSPHPSPDDPLVRPAP